MISPFMVQSSFFIGIPFAQHDSQMIARPVVDEYDKPAFQS